MLSDVLFLWAAEEVSLGKCYSEVRNKEFEELRMASGSQPTQNMMSCLGRS